MKNTIKKMLGLQPKNTSAFSDFFRNSSPTEKSKLIKEVIRESNNDQKRLMDEAAKLSTQAP